MSRWLSREDVRRLTGRVKYHAQRAELVRRGIDFTQGAGGEPLVTPEAVDGKPAKARNTGPRWDRMVQT